MKTALKLVLLIVAAGLPALFVLEPMGIHLLSNLNIEYVVAAFSVAGLLLTVANDYSYPRTGDVQLAKKALVRQSIRNLPTIAKPARTRAAAFRAPALTSTK
jgi:hypothetical protein